MRRQISRRPSRTPGASISMRTTGSGPPSSGRTYKCSWRHLAWRYPAAFDHGRTVPGVGNPVKLSRTPPKARTKPKKFGTDTRAVLAEAGYSAAEIDKLVASGIALTEIKKVGEDECFNLTC